jgi:alkanesulfonate monooxygenase SsuD/methylene tetrahydromethanopterin reductase-like flavin-dependent oxidoreductase (luciferase family)
MAAIFQNPGHAHGVSDYSVYRADMALALAAEGLGFDSVWGGEHHFTDYSMSPDPVQFLAFIAGQCRRVRLGTMVVVLPWHDPLRVAEKIAHLDALSDGRVIFGIGRGVARAEFNAFRVDMNESRERFVESAEMVLTGLERGYCEYEGKYVRQPRARLRPEPFKSFRNRSYAASVSPESARIMARLGVGLLTIPQKPWEMHAQDLASYQDIFLQTHGRPAPAPFVVCWILCDRDRGRAEELAQRYLGGYCDSVVAHYELKANYYANTRGYEYYAQMGAGGADGLKQMFLDMHVWGTPEMCYEKIKAIQERTGARGFVAVFSYAGMPEAIGRGNMDLFASEVLPELRKLGARPEFDDVEPPRAQRRTAGAVT